MPLRLGLTNALSLIADDLVAGTLSRKVDYGTAPYHQGLTFNGQGDADAALAFLDRRVRTLTDGRYGVVYADYAYLADWGGGMTMAYVPAGEDFTSAQAQYFVISYGPHGVHSSERAAASVIEAALRSRADDRRRHDQRAAGRALVARLTEVMRRRLHVLLTRPDTTLDDQLLGDLHALASVQQGGVTLPAILHRLEVCSLETLCALLRALDHEELPGYDQPGAAPPGQ
ncbi:hypothetical protein JNJ66_07360 [Candidatus Saccharibacteria bacterium]|nr:hypothetical protein [Candidatus Saccharibacteria bacterium]